MKRTPFYAGVLLASLLLAQGCSKGISAACALSPLGKSSVSGQASFTQHSGYTHIEIMLAGLKPGRHGIHVHEGIECGKDGKLAGAHFNPMAEAHGLAAARSSHEGDLGNVEADKDGNAKLSLDDLYLTLKGADSVIGRALVVHADPDDLKTQPAGNSGARIACGLIIQESK